MGTLRTILRRSFYTAAAVSTLLLVATLVVWPVSYYPDRYLGASSDIDTGGNYYWLVATSGRADGGFRSNANSNPLLPEIETNWSYLTWNTPMPDSSGGIRTYLGACCYQVDADPPYTQNGVVIPFSYLTLLFSLLPFLAFRSLRRRRQAARHGLCPKCSYDLRTQQSGAAGPLCPECGTPVSKFGVQPLG